jgi:pyridoxine/pyridoxamine 5'-phosphate oxidase
MREQVLSFVQRHRLAVQTSVHATGAPQAAVVGIVVTERFEVFFDTLDTSRKCQNLRRDPRVALVIGWDLEEGCTVQLEGRADEPTGPTLERLKQRYFEIFPDGVERQSWSGITYFRVQPSWLRFSDFRGPEPLVVEFDQHNLSPH